MSVAAPSVWDRHDTVSGFARSAPNPQLIEYARQHRCPWSSTRVLDIGCGAGRNAIPLAHHGFDVVGIDQSRPMLEAAASRACDVRFTAIEAAMDRLPIRDRSVDVIVAHGIWNLARSDHEFRAAVAEAARVAAEDCALFVFTFSRHTVPMAAQAMPGQHLVFNQFSGSPQIFLTEDQLLGELCAAGFDLDPDLPVSELNLPPPGQARLGGPPVIFQAGFRKRGA